jgi:hypothetical protein
VFSPFFYFAQKGTKELAYCGQHSRATIVGGLIIDPASANRRLAEAACICLFLLHSQNIDYSLP